MITKLDNYIKFAGIFDHIELRDIYELSKSYEKVFPLGFKLLDEFISHVNFDEQYQLSISQYSTYHVLIGGKVVPYKNDIDDISGECLRVLFIQYNLNDKLIMLNNYDYYTKDVYTNHVRYYNDNNLWLSNIRLMKKEYQDTIYNYLGKNKIREQLINIDLNNSVNIWTLKGYLNTELIVAPF